MIESRTDQPRTRPVALRKNRVGACPPIASVAILASSGILSNSQARRPGKYSAVHEKVLADLSLLRVQFQHRALQDAVTVDAPGVDRQRPAHFLDCPALVDMSVHGEHRLVLQNGVPYGGAWKLKIVRSMSGTWAATASIFCRRAASGASRNVSHGVGLVQPMETRWNPPGISTALASPKVTHGDDSMTSSISQMSSFPPFRMQGIAPPLSLPSAMSSHRSRERSISMLNRRSTAPSSSLRFWSSSGVTIAG